ncbi:hypothetical protein C3432_01955 [Citrobacter amalonaticus]|uniref:Uncharacterized protein n=1 Tax=Citrobacter amalonaticus TaxID=35703 RepID=A0A2S4S2L6_CITAM|nr:hypothetical protein [Citrobacter amalonaticus]POT59510.1 hypothetical protein C3432_01955 [Citrobacter amalonaticus]POT77640.1 hypothetical protein C3436_09625 [Citrobacter amalonaticus]POU68092.1 hypothetical protein C3430_03160 [Citrobacter amalonaticus]POV07696.1 hypothetical protein C3424_03170 [Citrobacter amalonaticus]
MENDGMGIIADDADVIEIALFSLHDPDFLTKYSALSAIWARLIQLKIVTIVITNDNVALRLFTSAQDRDVILNTYMDEVRNVFTNLQKI